MDTGDEQLAEALLARLRTELTLPRLEYAGQPMRLTGGYDTSTIAFSLRDGPPDLRCELVARIFREGRGLSQAERETRLHEVVAGAGYPAPPILHASLDERPPGAFLVMPRLPGKTLLQAMSSPPMLIRAPRLLATWHHRLHALDVSGCDDLPSMTDWPATLEQQVAEIGGGGFGPAVDWAARQAPRRTRPSLLHLDFHPGNILVAGRELTGVIDWANGATGDAAADVGTTIVLLTMGPADAPPWLAPVLTRVRRWLARRYLAEYRRLNRVAVADVRYYEALRCLRAMVHVALRRAGSDSETREVYAWHGPQQVANMTGRFHEITGIRLPVPPIAGRQGGG